MYTDKAYLVKDRFHDKTGHDKSISTLFRLPQIRGKESSADPDLTPTSYGGKVIPNCPPGTENLYTLTKVYLIKRVEMFKDDIFNSYKAELIDERGERLFLITSAGQHTSDEVIHYGKHQAIKLKGKVNYGALNYAGIQLFEIYGDPNTILRVGPHDGLWGEIQAIPNESGNKIQLNCCCINIGRRAGAHTEIRVVVVKKDYRVWKDAENAVTGEVYKHVYTLRGNVSTRCAPDNRHNFFYRKNFDLDIYLHDPFEPEKPKKVEDEEDSDEDEEDEDDEEEPGQDKQTSKPKNNPKPGEVPIGRLCSQVMHEKLQMHLPVLEFPQEISVYDKLTLMGTFFLFNLKI